MSESFRHLWGRTGDATPPTPDPRKRGEDGEFTALPYWEKAKRLGLPGDMVPAINAACDELFRLRAPARGVTEEEREVMGDIALDGFIDWCDLDPTDENRSASALARQYLALRQKSRTPDAEGGA